MRSIFLHLTLTIALLISGCATTYMYDDSRRSEDVIGIYSNPEESQLVLITKKHHYIANVDKNLLLSLALENRIDFEKSLGHIRVNRHGDFELTIELLSKSQFLSEADVNNLKSLGFRKNGIFLSYEANANGKAYIPKENLHSPQAVARHTILVSEESKVPNPVKYALTPITIALDGTVFLGGLVVAAIICDGSKIFGNNCQIP